LLSLSVSLVIDVGIDLTLSLLRPCIWLVGLVRCLVRWFVGSLVCWLVVGFGTCCFVFFCFLLIWFHFVGLLVVGDVAGVFFLFFLFLFFFVFNEGTHPWPFIGRTSSCYLISITLLLCLLLYLLLLFIFGLTFLLLSVVFVCVVFRFLDCVLLCCNWFLLPWIDVVPFC